MKNLSIQFNSIQFNSIQFNSIQFNSIQFWINHFTGKLKVGVVILLMMTMNACADKETTGFLDGQDVSVDTRTSICDFVFCNPKPWIPESKTFSYLGCPFLVSFEWRKCSQAVEVRNFDFVFDITNARCNTIIDSIGQFWLYNQSLQANTTYNAIYQELTLQVQLWVLAQLVPEDFESSTPISFQFIETDCHTLCIHVFTDQYENVSFELGHVKCGESCCVRSSDIRFDINGDAYVHNEELDGGEPCAATTVNCPGSYNSEICTPACDRL